MKHTLATRTVALGAAFATLAAVGTAQSAVSDNEVDGASGTGTPITGGLHGASIAIDDGYLVVGGPEIFQYPAPKTGYVYVYEKGPAGDWDYIVHFDGTTAIGFGDAVALDGDDLAVTGVANDAGEDGRGVVQFFHRQSSSDWIGRGTITTTGLGAPRDLGTSVDIDRGIAVVGAPGDLTSETGAVYVFEPNAAGVWKHVAQIPAPNAWDRGFGNSVAIDRKRIVIASAFSLPGNTTSGSVYVYERDSNDAWFLAQELTDPALAGVSLRDASVAIDGGRIAVGVPRRQVGSPALLQFGGILDWRASTGGGWSLNAILDPPQPAEDRAFGTDVALRGPRLAASSRPPLSGILRTGPGAVHLFHIAEDGSWQHEMRGVADDDRYTDELGSGGLALGESEFAAGLVDAGLGKVLLWNEVSLYQDGVELTASTGELHRFHLRADASLGGGLFVVLGSATGTTPTTPVGPFGVELPLVVDAYTSFLVDNLGAGPYLPWIGVMDANGHADTLFAVPPILDPSVVGTQLHHAFLLFDPVIGAPVAATNAVTLEFVE